MQEYIPGKNSVLEALKADVDIKEIYVEKRRKEVLSEEMLTYIRERNIPMIPLDKEALDELTEVRSHQGIIALIKSFAYRDLESVLSDLEKKEEAGFFIILDHVEDPHNFGAIARTALCGGASGIIIPSHRNARVTSTVMKVSAGSVFHIPIIQVTNISQTMEALKGKGYWIYGGDSEGSMNLFKTPLEGSIGIVVGNEGKGISPKVKKYCDGLITIPQQGPLGSLNVSVAAGLFIYEVFRNRIG